MRELCERKIRYLALGHNLHKWQTQDLKAGSLPPESGLSAFQIEKIRTRTTWFLRSAVKEILGEGHLICYPGWVFQKQALDIFSSNS